MKNLKPYRLFETNNSDYLSPDQIEFLEEHIVHSEHSFTRLKETGREKYGLRSDLYTVDPKTGMVEIFGNFALRYGYYNDLMGIKFSKIHGYMDLFKNNLKNCEGFPYEVKGYVDLAYNKIDSLEGCTQIVGESFFCDDNNLKTLEGGPIEVGGDYYVTGNPLVSLKGYPKELTKAFSNPFFYTKEFTLDNMLSEAYIGEEPSDERDKVSEIEELSEMELILIEKIKSGLASNPDEILKSVTPYWNNPDFQRLKQEVDFPDYFDKIIRSRGRFI